MLSLLAEGFCKILLNAYRTMLVSVSVKNGEASTGKALPNGDTSSVCSNNRIQVIEIRSTFAANQPITWD